MSQRSALFSFLFIVFFLGIASARLKRGTYSYNQSPQPCGQNNQYGGSGSYSQPNCNTYGQNNYRGGKNNYGGGKNNYGGGQSNYGGGQSNYGSGQSNYGSGQSNYGGGQSNYGGGQSNYGQGSEGALDGSPSQFGVGAPGCSGGSC